MSLLLLAVLGLSLQEAAPVGSPEELARKGLAALEAGEADEAVRLLEDARRARPDDRLLVYDLGCARLAAGDAEGAREAFLAASTAADPALAADARYNLGQAAARVAQEHLGPEPASLGPPERSAVLRDLEQAAWAFRSTLELEPEREEARQALELVLRVRKELEDLWRRRDEEQRREADRQEDPLRLLQEIQEEEDGLRAEVEALRSALPGPARIEASRQLGSRQEATAARLPVLRELLEKALQAEGGSEGAPAEAREAILGTVDRAHEALQRAAAGLAEEEFEGAAEEAARASALLDALWTALAPFPALVRRGLAEQEALLEEGAAREEAGGAVEAGEEGAGGRGSAGSAPLRAERQERIAGWVEVLPERGESFLAAAGGAGAEADGQAGSLQQAVEAARVGAAAAAAAAREAAGLLRVGETARARPRQTQVRDFLAGLAELLPESAGGGQGEGAQPPREPEQEPEGGEEPEPGETKPEEPGEKAEPQADPSRSPQALRPEDIAALLQKAREREEEYRRKRQELRLRLQAAAGGKDW